MKKLLTLALITLISIQLNSQTDYSKFGLISLLTHQKEFAENKLALAHSKLNILNAIGVDIDSLKYRLSPEKTKKMFGIDSTWTITSNARLFKEVN